MRDLTGSYSYQPYIFLINLKKSYFSRKNKPPSPPQTTQRLVDTTQNVRIVGRRDSGSWKYWLVIALLAVVIVILVSLPGKK